MPWEFVIVLLIPLGVWILGGLMRGNEEVRGRGNVPGRGPRRPISDLDRFLAEARRRREEAEGRRESAPVVELIEEPRQVPRPAIEPRPARPAPPRPPANRPPQTRRPPRQANPRPTRPQPSPVPAARPVYTAVPIPTPPPPVERGAPPAPALPPVEPVQETQAQPLAVALKRPGQAPPPAVALMFKLLRSPNTAGTAFLLREIFDQPGYKKL